MLKNLTFKTYAVIINFCGTQSLLFFFLIQKFIFIHKRTPNVSSITGFPITLIFNKTTEITI